MRLWVVAVGKIRQRALRDVADDYLERVRRYVRCDEVEVKDERALARAVPQDAVQIALEVDGTALDSLSFASRVERWGSHGKGNLAFLIGGADGLPVAVSRSATERISLSRLTLPHRLARVVLYEQIYRAMTLMRGEPYAREE